jgi:hypothetical protein
MQGFILWEMPTGVEVTEDGASRTLPIIDVQRLMQIALLVATVGVGIAVGLARLARSPSSPNPSTRSERQP